MAEGRGSHMRYRTEVAFLSVLQTANRLAVRRVMDAEMRQAFQRASELAADQVEYWLVVGGAPARKGPDTAA